MTRMLVWIDVYVLMNVYARLCMDVAIRLNDVSDGHSDGHGGNAKCGGAEWSCLYASGRAQGNESI